MFLSIKQVEIINKGQNPPIGLEGVLGCEIHLYH